MFLNLKLQRVNSKPSIQYDKSIVISICTRPNLHLMVKCQSPKMLRLDLKMFVPNVIKYIEHSWPSPFQKRAGFNKHQGLRQKKSYERQGHSQPMWANSQCFDIFVMQTIKSKQQLRICPHSPAVFVAFLQIPCLSSWRSSKMERN